VAEKTWGDAGGALSELVLALNLSLTFTSRRRSLCSARWRAQGWRGESDQKPLTKSGCPGCQVRRGGSKAIPSGRHQDVRRLCGTPPPAWFQPPMAPHAQVSELRQAGCIRFLRLWLCSSIFCLHVRRVPCAVVKPHATPGSAASPVPQPHLELCQRVQAVALAAEPHGPLQVVLDVTAAQVLRAHANRPRDVSDSADASGCV